MEGIGTTSSLQVLCSSSSSSRPHHHLLLRLHRHQLRVVARFPRSSSPSGIRLTTTTSTSLEKAAIATATATARCCSNHSNDYSTKDLPHEEEKEEKEEEEVEGWVEKLMGEKIVRDKCKEDERKGVAELLECLEREAIMGDDNGKQPTDYDRRAKIFYRSSRVFQDQALHHHPSPP